MRAEVIRNTWYQSVFYGQQMGIKWKHIKIYYFQPALTHRLRDESNMLESVVQRRSLIFPSSYALKKERAIRGNGVRPSTAPSPTEYTSFKQLSYILIHNNPRLSILQRWMWIYYSTAYSSEAYLDSCKHGFVFCRLLFVSVVCLLS